MIQNGKVYASIKETCEITGLSQHYLRDGCKAGTLPHIKSGNKYFICVPALLEQLESEARANAGM